MQDRRHRRYLTRYWEDFNSVAKDDYSFMQNVAGYLRRGGHNVRKITQRPNPTKSIGYQEVNRSLQGLPLTAAHIHVPEGQLESVVDNIWEENEHFEVVKATKYSNMQHLHIESKKRPSKGSYIISVAEYGAETMNGPIEELLRYTGLRKVFRS